LFLTACGEPTPDDAGMVDAGSADDGGDASIDDAGDSDAGMSDAGMSDAGMSDAGMSDAGMSDAGVLEPPLGITFRDDDLARGVIAGTVTLARASDETNVVRYEIVGLDAVGTIVGPALAAIPRTTDPLAHTFALGTLLPAGVVELAGVSTGSAASSVPGPSAPADNFVRYSDVGGDGGSDPLRSARLVRHAASGTLFAIGCEGNTRATVRRCGPGSGCSEIASLGTVCAGSSAAIAGNTLYVAATGSSSLALHICALDSSGVVGTCREHNLSTRTYEASVTVAASAVIITSPDADNEYRASVDLCPLDGPTASAPCTHHDVSAGQPSYSGQSPTALTVGDDLYVVATGGVFHCTFGASSVSGCTHTASGLEPAYPSGAASASRLYLATGSAVRSCALAADGTITTCTTQTFARADTRASTARPVILTGTGLYVPARVSGGITVLNHCALDASGDATSCTELAYSGPSGMAIPALFEHGTQLLGIAQAWWTERPFEVPYLLAWSRNGAGAPTAATYEEIGLRPLGYHGQSVRGFASPTHLYSLASLSSTPVLTSCALPIAETAASCITRALSTPTLSRGTPSYRDGAIYFFVDHNATLARCSLASDGSASCTTHDVRGGADLRDVRAGGVFGGRVVAIATDYGNGYRPTLFACTLDGGGLPGGCSTVVASSPGDLNSLAYGVTASATHGYAFMRESDGRALYACPFDASGALTACTRTIVDPVAENSGYIADMVLAGGRLYLSHVTSSYRPWLGLCQLDGSGEVTECTTADVTAGSTESLYEPALAVAGDRLYMAGAADDERADMIACDLGTDGLPTGCVRHDAAAGRGDRSAERGSGDLLFDPTEGTLYFVTNEQSNRHRPAAYWLPAF
jgi:hypothetical protein